MSAVLDREMTSKERAVAHLMTDLRDFCAFNLKVKPKVGRNVPFIWNRAQIYVHEQIEKQRRELGFVRALALKGRQQGISTYIGARFYHQTSTRKSSSAFIVSHEDKSTDNLFAMVKRYHSFNPLAPSTKYSNAKELLFGRMDSGYKLATAGSEDVGRGNTAQLLHGSEFGFWHNPQMHLAGLGNTIADAPGTEIILESTGNGLGNAFHLMWQEAELGNGLYIPIFVPWFWQEEYRSPVRGSLDLSIEDEVYMTTFGLDMEQMQWRADKISSYGSGFEWLFDQEYPATPVMAFQSSTGNPLIKPTLVATAMASDLPPDPRDPLIVGCDPAEQGFDRTAIVWRRGRVVLRVEYEDKSNTMGVVGRLAKIWKEQRPDAIFLDKSGLGAGIYDRLLELNVPVIGVNNASRARDFELFENRRAEMWWTMLEWFEDEPCRIPAKAMALASDLSAPEPRLHSSGRRLLEKKEDMRKRGMRSPDGGDALALTFYEPVARRELITGMPQQSSEPASHAGY